MSSTLNVDSLDFKNGSGQVNVSIQNTATAGLLNISSAVAGAVRVAGVAEPQNDGEASNKKYVDDRINGLSWLEPARVFDNTGVNPSTRANNVVVDGVTLQAGDRFVAGPLAGLNSGVWVVGTSNSVRSDDMLIGVEARNKSIWIGEGNSSADRAYVITNDKNADIVGTNNLNWVHFGNLSVNINDAVLKSTSTGDQEISQNDLVLSQGTQSSSTSTGVLRLTGNGGIGCGGNAHIGGTCNANAFNTTSDKNLKENIVDVATKPVVEWKEFDYKRTGKRSAGVLAQELQENLPHLVSSNANGILSVDYNGLFSLVCADLEERVKSLEAKVNRNEYDDRIDALKKNIEM